jgi:hypothetical protein
VVPPLTTYVAISDHTGRYPLGYSTCSHSRVQQLALLTPTTGFGNISQMASNTVEDAN